LIGHQFFKTPLPFFCQQTFSSAEMGFWHQAFALFKLLAHAPDRSLTKAKTLGDLRGCPALFIE